MIATELRIASIGRHGEGIAHKDASVVFVPYVLPGETVIAEVSDERAKCREIIESSPERIAPFCKFHGACGGCQLQHWQQASYAQWKRETVAAALRQQGVEADVAPLADAHGLGRRRVTFHVRSKDGKVHAGLMAPRSHHLTDIDICPVLVPALAKSADIARAIGVVAGNCDAAITAADNGLDVALKAEKKSARAVMERLTARARDWNLARLSLNGETVAQLAQPVIEVDGIAVPLPVQSFLQATQAGETSLAEKVLKWTLPAKRAADLFCGVGPFALRLAKYARVDAFDSDATAVAALAQAVRRATGLKPLAAKARNLFREPLTVTELNAYDAVVFDPPRAGAEAQARKLAASKVNTVIAVSCDPSTFARDARILIDGSYRLETVVPVDQFKWTSHVEIAACFARR
jgi:23S rRNA (uracil1939-C5)-methyltransferase